VDALAGRLLPAPLERSLVEHVAASRPDLVIKSAQHPPAVPVAALLQTDWMLAHAMSAPLLLAGGRPWPDMPLIAVISEGAERGAGEPTLAAAHRLCAALAGGCESVPARWSDASRCIDYLRNRGVSLVAMPDAALRTVDAALILDQLEADLLIIPAGT
jgi:hypothetical protein